ncbi:MAG: flagellar hook protein FlgE [Gammaproteobacteria bacterium]|nr:flagellar hook protein FlgE [Gammaproteobacteria bacterium]
MPFQVALSGLRAAQTELEVLGNNIANVNTTGFKESRAEFSDVYSVTNVGGAGNNPGRGVNTSRIAQQFSQGSINFTDNGLDLAISGEGFFIVEDDGARLFTRDGSFGLDREGFIVNAKNQQLIAFQTDATGAITGASSPLQISRANSAPSPTDNVQVGVNLDSQSPVPASAPFDPLDATSYNNSTAATVYDSLGGEHLLQVYFVKGAGANAWSVNTVVDGVQVGGPDALTFDTVGGLATPAGGTVTVPAFLPAPGTNPLNLTIDYSQSTQFGAPFGVNRLVQNGYTTGRLSGVDIDDEGVVFARYTNGQSEVQGQVALASFQNPQGLQPLGENNWAQTLAAGEELTGAPGSSSLGLIQAGALEDSNVDLSEQLVELIIAQRNFQANTEVISTADSITQSVINIR